MDLVCLKVPQWEKKDGLLHGFLGRRGGKSSGPFGSLNLSFGVGDDPQVVKDNLCDVKKAVGIHDLRVVTMKQVHGDHIVEVRDKHLKEAGEADGMITDEKEVFLGVLTADCVPILFAVPGREVVAAVHAGWRGALAGIAPKMVRYLRDRYDAPPASIEAAMGPAIGPCCYEIGADVSEPIVKKWGRLGEGCLQTKDGKTFLNLREFNRLQLNDAGVSPEKIYQIGPCTSCASGDFFSYRGQKGKTGHQMSYIGWLS
jgi:YfiH family protein